MRSLNLTAMPLRVLGLQKQRKFPQIVLKGAGHWVPRS